MKIFVGLVGVSWVLVLHGFAGPGWVVAGVVLLLLLVAEGFAEEDSKTWR